MAEGAASYEELQSNLKEYEGQLKQVNGIGVVKLPLGL